MTSPLATFANDDRGDPTRQLKRGVGTLLRLDLPDERAGNRVAVLKNDRPDLNRDRRRDRVDLDRGGAPLQDQRPAHNKPDRQRADGTCGEHGKAP